MSRKYHERLLQLGVPKGFRKEEPLSRLTPGISTLLSLKGRIQPVVKQFTLRDTCTWSLLMLAGAGHSMPTEPVGTMGVLKV